MLSAVTGPNIMTVPAAGVVSTGTIMLDGSFLSNLSDASVCTYTRQLVDGTSLADFLGA